MRYGKLKPQVIREMDLPSQDNISLTSTETPPPLYVPGSQHGMQKVKNHQSSDWINKILLPPAWITMTPSLAADRGPFGSRASLSYGRGGRWLQRASDPHHPWRCLALLFHQLPLRTQPAASTSKEGVCGKDELQGRRCPCQGALHTRKYSEAGPEAKLYPRQLHGGHSGLS